MYRSRLTLGEQGAAAQLKDASGVKKEFLPAATLYLDLVQGAPTTSLSNLRSSSTSHQPGFDLSWAVKGQFPKYFFLFSSPLQKE